jgi:Tfp pilus assembly protein PilF
MGRVAAAYPSDVEAQAFFSLSLLGLNQGERDVPAYMRAAAIATPIFAAHPMHPGAAHYLIHAFDDPAHAPLGLPAARAYSGIAPSAPHAQHMTSHIFLALGMWDETVQANEIATTIRDSAGKVSRWSCGHYGEWLQYAYLQQGRPREAARLLDECRVQAQGARRARARASLARMRAVQIAEAGHQGDEAVRLTIDTTGLSAPGRALITIGNAQAAARRGDAALLRASRAQLAATIGPTGAAWPGYGEISLRLLDGLVARATGDSASALIALRRAAAIEDSLPVDFGPPLAITPAHDVLGETLLRFGRAVEAKVELERQLARTPRRAATLVVLARAATASGDLARAATAYEELAAISRRAEPTAPVRAELQRANRVERQ